MEPGQKRLRLGRVKQCARFEQRSRLRGAVPAARSEPDGVEPPPVVAQFHSPAPVPGSVAAAGLTLPASWRWQPRGIQDHWRCWFPRARWVRVVAGVALCPGQTAPVMRWATKGRPRAKPPPGSPHARGLQPTLG